MNITQELEMYDDSGWAYEQQLEFQRWYETVGWLDEVNSELRFAALDEGVEYYGLL